MAWWYADKEKKSGPVEKEELGRLLLRGRINSSTMLWREGMEGWKPLGEIDELNDLKVAVPPPLPPKVESDPLTYPLAARWPRFFARMFDLWWETLLVAVIFGQTLGRYSADYLEWISKPGSGTLFGLICVLGALPLDAALYSIVGNTPGKALLGLKVSSFRANALTFSEYLNRNFGMWVSGLALGFPLFNLFTMANQARRLARGAQATYDESHQYRVRARPIGVLRKLGFAICFVALFAGMAILNSMDRMAEAEIVRQDYTWENPQTRRATKVPGRWKHSVQSNQDGWAVYIFTDASDRALVVFAVERARGFRMSDYAPAFVKNTQREMRFADGGRYSQTGGRSSWEAVGTMATASDQRVKVQVVQIGEIFWRAVSTQTMPYAYSDAHVDQLKSLLWSTVQ